MPYLPQNFVNPQEYLSPRGGAGALSQQFAAAGPTGLAPGTSRFDIPQEIQEFQSPLGKREFLQQIQGPQITAGERALNQLLLSGAQVPFAYGAPPPAAPPAAPPPPPPTYGYNPNPWR